MCITESRYGAATRVALSGEEPSAMPVAYVEGGQRVPGGFSATCLPTGTYLRPQNRVGTILPYLCLMQQSSADLAPGVLLEYLPTYLNQ